MNRTDRLYALVEELRATAPRARAARRLAERFEVSVRTIERDILALQQAGVPIWATPGPGGGYKIDPAHTRARRRGRSARRDPPAAGEAGAGGRPGASRRRAGRARATRALPGLPRQAWPQHRGTAGRAARLHRLRARLVPGGVVPAARRPARVPPGPDRHDRSDRGALAPT